MIFIRNLQIFCIFSAKNLVVLLDFCNFVSVKQINYEIMNTTIFSPFVCMEQIAEALCVSTRTASRYCQPLRKSLGLRRSQSFTKKQIEEYFGSSLKRPL